MARLLRVSRMAAGDAAGPRRPEGLCFGRVNQPGGLDGEGAGGMLRREPTRGPGSDP